MMQNTSFVNTGSDTEQEQQSASEWSFAFGTSPNSVAASPFAELQSKRFLNNNDNNNNALSSGDGTSLNKAMFSLFEKRSSTNGGRWKSGVDSRQNDSSAIERNDMLSLQEFIELLPETLRKSQQTPSSSSCRPGASQDIVRELFERVDLSDTPTWAKYVHFGDGTKNYTRNLIATDHETFTLLLLCWNPGKESPIHDHPCDGCWMRVLQGQVQECRYRSKLDAQLDAEDSLFALDGDDASNNSNQHEEKTLQLECTQDRTFAVGKGVIFINDSLGYHKVGNPSAFQPAITMHLYSPPFERCRIWLQQEQDNSNNNTTRQDAEEAALESQPTWKSFSKPVLFDSQFGRME